MKPDLNVAILIPARFESVRFPGKPLAMIKGKPMVQWVAERSRLAWPSARLAVATDDERIQAVVMKAGFEVVMTRKDHPTGSDRINEAAQKLDLSEETLIVNVQGDEPLVRADWIRALITPFESDPRLRMSTIAHKLTEDDLHSMNAVKVLVNRHGNAMYFTRYSAPYSRVNAKEMGLSGSAMKHMGFYAYKKSFLAEFCQSPPSFCEQAESLEQLRALELGERIFVTQVKGRSQGVDTPDDLAKMEALWNSKDNNEENE